MQKLGQVSLHVPDLVRSILYNIILWNYIYKRYSEITAMFIMNGSKPQNSTVHYIGEKKKLPSNPQIEKHSSWS